MVLLQPSIATVMRNSGPPSAGRGRVTQVIPVFLHIIFNYSIHIEIRPVSEKPAEKPDTGKLHSTYIGVNVCGSAYDIECMVNGMCVLWQWILFT